mgnify:CR=1 FL=1
MKACFRLGLYKQGLLHDLSKYSPVEFLVGVKYYQGDSSPIDAAKKDKGYSMAWFHHRGRNLHHHVMWIDNFDETVKKIKDYLEDVEEEIADENTEWDIVQGNVINAELWNSRFYNMQAAVYGKNAYAGNATWTEVLSEDAYITDKSGQNTDCFIMNSINLNTGWFINEVALEKAYDAGYRNADGQEAYPKTWQDIIDLCGYQTFCADDAVHIGGA